jgi:hypothetical protein
MDAAPMNAHTHRRAGDTPIAWSQNDHDTLIGLAADVRNLVSRFDRQAAEQTSELAQLKVQVGLQASRIDSLEGTRDKQLGAVTAGRVGSVLVSAGAGVLSALCAVGGLVLTGLVGKHP